MNSTTRKLNRDIKALAKLQVAKKRNLDAPAWRTAIKAMALYCIPHAEFLSHVAEYSLKLRHQKRRKWQLEKIRRAKVKRKKRK